MSKTSSKRAKPSLIVSQGDGWHIAYDRETKDYTAIVEGVGSIGSRERPSDAQSLVERCADRQVSRVVCLRMSVREGAAGGGRAEGEIGRL